MFEYKLTCVSKLRTIGLKEALVQNFGPNEYCANARMIESKDLSS